jgi:hypothetical protein
VAEAVEWLEATYLYTRASRSPNPLEYGITLAQVSTELSITTALTAEVSTITTVAR